MKTYENENKITQSPRNLKAHNQLIPVYLKFTPFCQLISHNRRKKNCF